MIYFQSMNRQIAIKFNNYIDEEIIRYALFDNNFTDEYDYYKLNDVNKLQGTINNYLFAIYDGVCEIGYIVLNIFIDKEKLVGCVINPIIVFKKYRRNGYGYQILERLKKETPFKENIDYFECAIDIENKKSFQLFLKGNFTNVGSERNFIHMKYVLNKKN